MNRFLSTAKHLYGRHIPQSHTGKPTRTDDEQAVVKCLQLTSQGYLSRAARTLERTSDVRPVSAAEGLPKLKDLHPQGDNPPSPPHTVLVPEVLIAEIKLAASKVTTGAAPGPNGTSDELLAILCNDSICAAAICKMCTLIIRNEMPQEIRTRITRSKLVGLSKPDGGIRPIAIGDSLLKLAAIVLATRLEKPPSSGTSEHCSLGTARRTERTTSSTV